MVLKCTLCDYSAEKQGGIIQDTGKDEPKIVCGLHLDPTGDNLIDGEVTGSWEVIKSWGFESYDDRVVKLWDKGMERFGQAGEERAGWKVVATVGDVSLEVSCVPKGNGRAAPGPVKKTEKTELTNKNIHEGLEWKVARKDGGGPAGPNSGWAWAWMQDQDQSQTPIQEALQAAIGPTEKAQLMIGEMTYTIGGREKNLFNRAKKKEAL